MRKYISLLILILLLNSCEDKIWDNPFDSKNTIKKEEWTPENLSIHQISLNTFQLSWKNIDKNIEGYRVDRKIAGFDWAENYLTVEADTLDYIILNDTTVLPDTRFEYIYRVYAYAGKNLSNPVESKITPEFPPISDVSVEQLAPTVLKIEWQDNTNGEDGYYLRKKIDNGNWFNYDTLAENTTTYIDSAAVPNKMNYYEFTIFYDQYFCTCEAIMSNIKFKAPTDLEIVKQNLESVKITWKDNVTGEDSYKIDRQKDGGEWKIGYVVLDENIEEFVDTDIETNHLYAYRVYACSNNYETDKVSDQITVNFEAPQNLHFNQKNLNEIEISWDADDQGEDGFKLFREDEFGQWELISDTQDQYFADTNPNYGENNYKLFAYFNDQKSDSLIQVFDNILLKPINLTSEILTSSSVKLLWNNQCNFDHQISVERKSDGNDFTQIALLSSDLDEYTDESIDSTVTYIYALRAYFDPYYSEYSDVDTVLVVKPLPFETVDVLAGNFIFGSSNSTQNIPYDYVISKYEITNAEYASFLQKVYDDGLISVDGDDVIGNYGGDDQYVAGKYTYYDLGDDDSRITFSNGHFSVKSTYEYHPVAQVSWFGANAFARYYRCSLPTDFEWEKAARGNNTRVYPWGSDIESNHCNYLNSGDPYDNGTTPVGFYNGANRDGYTTRDNASYYGAYDMAGNVWEWTSSWYTDGSDKYSTRGGSWYNSESYMASYTRYPVKPSATYGYVGFRIMRKK